MATRPAGMWRQRARGVIGPLLHVMPADVDRPGAERVLRDHYPFGERIGWAYKMWCQEKRAALDERFGPMKPREKAETVTSGPLGVTCRHCGGSCSGGCILCMGHVSWWRSLTAGMVAEWEGMMADKDAADMLADWVEENGNGLPGLAGGRTS